MEIPESVLDKAAALAGVDGDSELLVSLVQTFLDNLATQMKAVREAIVRNDARALELAAHALKGSAGSFGAKEFIEAAAKLEAVARGRNLVDAEGACQCLEAALGRLKPALVTLKNKLSFSPPAANLS